MLRLVLQDGQNSVTIADANRRGLAACSRSCELSLTPGNYLLLEREGERDYAEYELLLVTSATVKVEAPNAALGALGFALGLLGVAGAIASLPLLVPAPDDSSYAGHALLGLGLFTASSGASAGGWRLFAHNLHTRFDESHTAPAIGQSSWATPQRSGFATSISFTF
jgi:hypothetical protein